MTYTQFQAVVEEVLCGSSFQMEWVTGGLTGGSCWDTGDDSDRYSPVDGQPEPEFELLDDVLLKVCPEMSYLQYKKLSSCCVEGGSRTEPEYYGNYTYYGVKTVDVRKLYDVLSEMELL